jgi:hypothetical protein
MTSSIGIDLGKRVFHVHGQDAKGHVIFRKKLSRLQLLPFFSNLKAVIVVMEACACSRWLARKLIAMEGSGTNYGRERKTAYSSPLPHRAERTAFQS